MIIPQLFQSAPGETATAIVAVNMGPHQLGTNAHGSRQGASMPRLAQQVAGSDGRLMVSVNGLVSIAARSTA